MNRLLPNDRHGAPPASSPRLVVIAASAGALPAIIDVLAPLPPEFPAAIALVQHRGYSEPEQLIAILARRTRLRVCHPADGALLEAGTVYVCPPGVHMTTEHCVRLIDGPKLRFVRPNADLMFDSVSKAYGDRAIGVVLSGCGSDAAVGSLAIAHAGGTVIAQDVGEIACVTSETFADLIERVRAGAGVLVVTEEALSPAGVTELLAVMGEQPSWSDLPIVLLLASDEGGARETGVAGVLRLARTVTVLKRPVAAVTVLTAVQSSLRARRRQYEVRDLLASERRAREQAEAATRIKDEFLATVSHELRTPVSAILLWAQLLEAGRLSGERATQAMHAITSSAEAQSRLIEDLLDLSRMLMGKLRIEVQPRALRPILRAAIEVVRPMADAKGIRLDLLLDPHDELVLVDADRVQQILWNLLCNAVKFTGAGGVVSLRLVHAHGRATVTVSDTGEGIGPELLPHVFERFRRTELGSSRRQGGLGLGLSIVRQLVELHGGTIDVASPGRGQGATFTVRLPLAPGG